MELRREGSFTTSPLSVRFDDNTPLHHRYLVRFDDGDVVEDLSLDELRHPRDVHGEHDHAADDDGDVHDHDDDDDDGHDADDDDDNAAGDDDFDDCDGDDCDAGEDDADGAAARSVRNRWAAIEKELKITLEQRRAEASVDEIAGAVGGRLAAADESPSPEFDDDDDDGDDGNVGGDDDERVMMLLSLRSRCAHTRARVSSTFALAPPPCSHGP